MNQPVPQRGSVREHWHDAVSNRTLIPTPVSTAQYSTNHNYWCSKLATRTRNSAQHQLRNALYHHTLYATVSTRTLVRAALINGPRSRCSCELNSAMCRLTDVLLMSSAASTITCASTNWNAERRHTMRQIVQNPSVDIEDPEHSL